MAEDIGNVQTVAGVEILTTNQVCKYLGLSRTHLYKIRKTDTSFPSSFTLTGDKGDLKWKLDDVKEWALNKMEKSNEE